MVKSFEHWLKIAENNQSNNLDESKKVHKYELHFSDGIRGMRGGENVDSLIRYAKSIKGIKEWSIFKTGTGFHGTHQDEFLVSWWDKDGNSYWSNRSVKEPKLLDKKHEEFKVNESKSLDLIDNQTRFEDISEIKDIIRSKVESTFKLKDITFTRFGQTYYEYGYNGKGFSGRTRDEYIINLPNQDPIKYLNDKEKELLYALSPNFFNNSKNRTPIFLKVTIGKAISIQDGNDDKKYHIIRISLNIYNADSNVTNSAGIYFNELLSGTSLAYAKVSMKSHDFITKGLLDDFYFKYNNLQKLSSNTVSQGIGSAASDLVTTSYKNSWDVSALMDIFNNDDKKVLEFLRTNFHFNRLKNVSIDNNILHANSSSTIKYDNKNINNNMNKINENFDINRFRELSKISQVQELSYILNKEFSEYTFTTDGLNIVSINNILADDLKKINDYIHNLIGNNNISVSNNLDEKLTDKASNYISKKIVKLREEGYPQKQAVAIAYSYAKKKGYKVDESKSSLQDKIQKFKDLKDSKDIIVASGSTESLYYFPTDDNAGTIFLVVYNPMSKNWDIMTFDYWNGTKKDILDLTSKEGAKKAYGDSIGEEEPNEDEYEVMNLLTGSEAIESYNRLLNKIESEEFSKKLLSESFDSTTTNDFTPNDYMYYAKAIGKKLKANNLYDYKIIYADSNDATGNGEGQFEIGNFIYEYNVFDYSNVDTKDGLEDKVNFKVRVYKDDFEIGYNKFTNIDYTNVESLITNYIVDLILTEGKNLNESHNGSGLIVKGRTDMDTEKIKDFLVSSDFYGEWDAAEDYFFFPEEQSLLISLEKMLMDEFDKLDIEVNITTTGLNEAYKGGWINTKIYRKSDSKEFNVIDFKNYGSYQELFAISNDNEEIEVTLGHPLNKENDFFNNYTTNKSILVPNITNESIDISLKDKYYDISNLLNDEFNRYSKIDLMSLIDINLTNDKITFDARIKGVWMKGEDITNIKNILKDIFIDENVEVIKNDGYYSIIITKNNLNEGSIFHDAPHQTNEDFWKTHFLSIIEELDFPKSYKIKEWKDLLDDDKEKIKIFRLSLFENINESLSKEKIDEHVLAFYIKYGKDYYNNDASILEFLQNNDEEHTDEESINQFKNALKDTLKKYESHIPVFVNVKIQNWKQYFENSKHNDIYKKVLNLVTENVQNSNIKDIIKIDDIYEFKLISNNNDILLPTLIYEYIKK